MQPDTRLGPFSSWLSCFSPEETFRRRFFCWPLVHSSGNCVGVGTHSHVWDCGSPRYTRVLPADTHWTRAEHLAVRPRPSTRRKLSSLTAAYGRRSQFTCPAHVVEPRGEPAKHDLTAAYLAGRRRPLQAHVAESYPPAIAEHPRGKSHALQEYGTFAPAVHRPEKPRAQRGRTSITERGEQDIIAATCGLLNTVRETQLADQPAATCGLRRESRREVADLSQYGPETVLARKRERFQGRLSLAWVLDFADVECGNRVFQILFSWFFLAST
ncbi:uncharacterized protein LOC128093388 [Culex pipiens pallens]|uniref:uncharacterized protein LOC128093388 n=1 Tax=Culex pipiens pallens TaxID=42434 RepID=UPI0022AA2792|nr:uncharacterized protein LOC128093388 [Culex pipiens pallens]